MIRRPCLACRDQCIAGLLAGQQRGEWPLARVMPRDQLGFRDLQSLGQADKARNQVQDQIEVARAATCHDDPLVHACDDQSFVRIHADTWEVFGKQRCVTPMDSGFHVVQQPGRASITAAVQELAKVAPASWHLRSHSISTSKRPRQGSSIGSGKSGTQTTSDEAIGKSVVRFNPGPVCGLNVERIGGHDIRQDTLRAWCACGDKRPVSAGRRQQIVHRIQHRGGDLGVGQDRDTDSSFGIWHGGNDRFFADSTLMPKREFWHRGASGAVKGGQRMDETAVTALREIVRGLVLRPDDAGYDATRSVWNGMIDRRPRVIVRCHGVADVIAAVNYARSHALRVAVRGGGHGVSGHAVCDDGMMIDLSGMHAVRVAPEECRAWVQGGATWGDVDCETTAFGLATPGGLISTTGVGGLTLSGGVGWLRGTSGLCVDNLMAADVVLADGQLLHASETDNQDLYWAIRGGGGNFGIVVGFEFRLRPIEPTLMFCAAVYPETRAAELLASWRDFMMSAPARVSSLAEFSTIPDDPEFPEEARGVRVLALAAVFDGPADDGEALMAPLRHFGTPLLDFSAKLPYRTIQAMYDPLYPKGRDRSYFRSLYLPTLDDRIIEELVGGLALRPSKMKYSSIWYFGEQTRVGDGDPVGVAAEIGQHSIGRTRRALGCDGVRRSKPAVVAEL
jgi:hypothetical protein